jgi:hypothetical protein
MSAPGTLFENPLVRGRPHRDRADAANEFGVVVREVELKQPVEGVLRIGEEAVQRGGGVVESFHDQGVCAFER